MASEPEERATEAAVSRPLRVAGMTTLVLFFGALIVASVPSYGVRLTLPLMLVLAAIPALISCGLLARVPLARRDLLWIFAIGLVVRIVFAVPEPYLSDDAYRYLWDGRVQLSGQSPYGVPPQAPELDDVEENVPEARRIRERVNHPDIATVYPPAMEAVFAVNALLDRVAALAGAGVLFTWRLLLLFGDLGIALLIVRALTRRNLDPRLVVLYLWHPLPVVELLWSCHAEGVAVLLLLVAIDRLDRARATAGAAWLGLAGAAKLFPFAMFPLIWRRGGIKPLLFGSLVAGVVAIPYALISDARALTGLGAYAQAWYFNDVSFHVFGWLAGIDVEDRTLAQTQWLRRGIIVGFGLVALVTTLRVRDPYRAGFAVALAFVLLTPTLHPWYLLWLLPFAIVVQSGGGVLLATMVLLAHVQVVQSNEVGVWEDTSALVKLLQFGPPLTLLAWQGFRAWRRSRSPVVPPAQ